MNNPEIEDVVVIGAGPAGLTAGSELSKDKNFRVTILEKDNKVGGLSKTTEYKGCKFDIGPHHFITKSAKVEKWWKDLMKGGESKGNVFLQHKRFTRIYYRKHFFYYPLQPLNVLKGLSLWECILCTFSYFKYTIFPIKKVKSLQDFFINRFGRRLFGHFFKSYTEKLWGIRCDQISAKWAKERIRGFSLFKAIFYAFFGRWFKKNIPRTIADKFYYPELGAGTLWDKVSEKIMNNENSNIHCNEKIVRIKHRDKKILSISTYNTKLTKLVSGKLKEYNVDYLFSSMPLKDLVLSFDPLLPQHVIEAANKLRCRALITVNLIVNKKDVCPDHWLYMHEPEVGVIRIGNMNNFSLKMVDNQDHTALSLEYFTFIEDDLWKKSDDQLLEMGKEELDTIGFVSKNDILDGMILREDNAYPIYDPHYTKSFKIVTDYLSQFSNLFLMGRNGLHKYNNMDIAMLSAFKVVDKLLKNNNKKSIYSRDEGTIPPCHPELVSGSRSVKSRLIK